MNGKEGEYAGHEKNENVNQILEGRQRATETAGSFIEGNQPIRRRGDGREGVEEVVGTPSKSSRFYSSVKRPARTQ